MKTSLCVLVAVMMAAPVAADTYVTSHIVTDTTWNLAGSPYIIQGGIWVDASSALTIDPGVVVRFETSANLEAQEGSSIVAIGTLNDPILFTSDSGTPVAGDWNFVGLDYSPASEFSHCVFEYAQYDLSLFHSDVTVSFCTMRYAEVDGITCDQSSPTITSCTVVSNSRGIKINGPDVSPVIHYCNIYNNGENLQLYNYEELPIVTINAEHNWWGTDDEEEIGWLITIHDDAEGFVEVDFDPWLHEVPVEATTWGRVKALFAD